ncbi:hypothetical protein B0H12DRAFT_1101065 [Mycena haematopus]|nr:hypothetical protein B0H12DRAFT_1101065 [Mycena haematopus]
MMSRKRLSAKVSAKASSWERWKWSDRGRLCARDSNRSISGVGDVSPGPTNTGQDNRGRAVELGNAQ